MIFSRLLMFICICLVAAGSISFARDVSVRWDSNTESDLAGYKIYYKIGSAAEPFDIVGATKGPSDTTATLTGLDPALTYYLAATAYNEAGIESLLSDVVVFYDIVPPSVSITAPAHNSTVIGSTNVTVDAVDASGISKVELYVDSVLQSTKTTTPYTFNWDTATIPEKKYTIFAVAFDIAGNEAQSSSVQVTVSYPDVPPNLTIADALLTLRFVLGIETATAEQFVRSDLAPINLNTHKPMPDGILDMNDVLVMLRRAVGLPW